jgi:hypothetical protein
MGAPSLSRLISFMDCGSMVGRSSFGYAKANSIVRPSSLTRWSMVIQLSQTLEEVVG